MGQNEGAVAVIVTSARPTTTSGKDSDWPSLRLDLPLLVNSLAKLL